MTCALIRLDTGLPFVADAVLVQNADGSVSFALPNNGGWAGQAATNDPNVSVYGERHPNQPANETPGSYQRATKDGEKAVFVTRPGDAPQVYLIGQGKAY